MKTDEPLGHYIDLTTRDGAAVRTFVAESRQAPRAVVVVLQHMDQRRPGSTHKDRSPAASGENRPGVNPHARHMCEAFAREGYLALAPSTFGRGVSGVDYGYRVESTDWSTRLTAPLQALPSPQVMHDIEAAVLHAGRVAPNLGVVMAGFCWGGLLAWRAAAQFKQLRACVSHYPGGIEAESERALAPLCPVLVQFATDSRWMPHAGVDGFVRTQAARAPLEPSAPQVECHVHEARYGFMQQQHPHYSEPALGAAWRRTLAFLGARAGSPG
jgi:carboxymethylenebutenolidase